MTKESVGRRTEKSAKRTFLCISGVIRRLLHLTIICLLPFINAASVRAATLPPVKTVFIIMEENSNWSGITPSGMPYLWNTLIPMGSYAKQDYNPPGIHPSEPNYIWLEAGNNMGLTNDNDPSASHSTNTTDHLVTYFNNKGMTWKSYQEDITGTVCPLSSSGNYAAKHNPFVFF